MPKKTKRAGRPKGSVNKPKQVASAQVSETAFELAVRVTSIMHDMQQMANTVNQLIAGVNQSFAGVQNDTQAISKRVAALEDAIAPKATTPETPAATTQPLKLASKQEAIKNLV